VEADELHSLPDPEAWGPRLRQPPFRLFISHTSPHRVLAAEIGQRLNDLGVDAFVAHSTITAADEWQKVIETALRFSDGMAALITPDFKSSEYCDQEVGAAIALGLHVIPLRQGADPHGFLRNRQGLPGDTSPEAGLLLGDSIYDALLEHQKTEGKMAEVFAFRYGRSRSQIEALVNLKCLLGIREDHWSTEVIAIVRAAERENTYVRGAVAQELRSHLEELFGASFLRVLD
jgi:hypothetical protein